MGDKGDLLSGKNLLWLVVIAVIVAVIVIVVVHRRDHHDEATEDESHEAHETLHSLSRRDRKVLLIVGGVIAGAIVLYGLWYYGYLSVKTEHHHLELGRKARSERSERGSSQRPSSLRSQSARGVRSPPRQSPFLTNEERASASIRSPARGSLSSLSTESNL